MNKIELYESGSAKGLGKRRRAKLISADVWGSSAFYPADVLERDAQEVFQPGVKMYENHFTESEELERPEGDVARMVGKLVSYGMYEAENPDGPGIYADVEFYDSYVPRINEIAGDVGLSIAGAGDYIEDEIAGRFGKIITKLHAIHSVDVVTKAGAGGKLISILESARPIAGRLIETEGDQSVTALTKDEFEAGILKLTEALKGSFDESITGLTVALKESLVAPVAAVEPIVDPVVDTTVVTEAAKIDHAAILVALSEAKLPNAVIAGVVTSIQEGASIADAVATQVTLKEAFEAEAKANTVRITEAATTSTGTLGAQVLATLSK
jgi:hypothetical protein